MTVGGGRASSSPRGGRLRSCRAVSVAHGSGTGTRDSPVLILHGSAAGTTLTGTLYEPGETPPRFRGAPDDDAPYVWVCDEFYEVETGGSIQSIDGQEIRIAFETPVPRGFHTRTAALAAAKDHLRTQFARIGVPREAVSIEIRQERQS